MSLRDLPLTLQLTERRWVGTGPERRLERIPLADVTQAMQRHPAFVLLGPPGCGKSTVLRRLTLDVARAYLTGQDTRLPMRINLANYAGPQANPLAFLTQQWINEGLPGDFVNLRPGWRGGAAGRWPQRNGTPGDGERAPATGQ